MRASLRELHGAARRTTTMLMQRTGVGHAANMAAQTTTPATAVAQSSTKLKDDEDYVGRHIPRIAANEPPLQRSLVDVVRSIPRPPHDTRPRPMNLAMPAPDL